MVKKSFDRKKLLTLILSFLKIGAFTFGGGYAMIPLLQDEFVLQKKWVDEPSFANMVAIAESTPGPIAVNAATYIGYRACGITGAICATVSVALPSLIILYLVSLFLEPLLTLPVIANAFRGIRVCVIFLILSAAIRMMKGQTKTAIGTVFVAFSAVIFLAVKLFSVNVSTILLILAFGALRLVLFFFTREKEAAE